MSQYLSPFKQRNFFARYVTAFRFQLQNFKVLAIMYIVFAIPLTLLIENCNITLIRLFLTIILGIGLCTCYYAIFKQYFKRKQAAILNYDLIEECKSVLVRVIILSLIIILPFLFIVFVFSFIFGLAIGFFIVLLSYNIILAFVAALLIIIPTIATFSFIAFYFFIPFVHYVISTDKNLSDSISEGFKLLKGNILSTQGYGIFCSIIYILLHIGFLILVLKFLGITDNIDIDNYVNNINNINNLYYSGAYDLYYFLILNTFVLAPMLYQYGHVIAKSVTREKEEESNATYTTTESDIQKPRVSHTYTKSNSTTPIESSHNTKQTEVELPPKNETTPTPRKGVFRIEGNGSYSIEIIGIKNDQQISESLYILLGYNKADAQSIVNNLPATIAEKLSMSEALDLKALIEQTGGSVNIK